ncbi:hypothetical protein [Hyphobacterium sp.]|uniref:hypothetical protein n=1 Tax=Hyphobacterium sp. TaxID=2004662 RepID=UPI003B52946F
MVRIGLICACMAGLSACVATPMGSSGFVSGASSLPMAQQSLRREAEAFDEHFHEAGWVAEEHGAAVQRLTGMLFTGRRDEERPHRIDVYYAAAGLEGADSSTILEQARSDLAEAAAMVIALVGTSEDVLAETGLTESALGGDIAALERAIGDTRQAITLFHAVAGTLEIDDSLFAEIGTLELAAGRLSEAADALAARRRALRDTAAS